MDPRNFHIWQGVYRSFREVPAGGPGFHGERFVQKSLEGMTQVREAAHSGNQAPEVTQFSSPAP